MVENAIVLIKNYMEHKHRQGDKFESGLIVFLAKFEVADVNYIEATLDWIINTAIKPAARKGRIDKVLLSFIQYRWRQFAQINFDEVIRGAEGSEKQQVVYAKSELAKFYENIINDHNFNNDIIATISELVKPKDVKNGKEDGFESPGIESGIQIDLAGESILEALREEVGEKKKSPGDQDFDDPNSVISENSAAAREDKYRRMLEMSPELAKGLDQKLQAKQYFQIDYYDKVIIFPKPLRLTNFL